VEEALGCIGSFLLSLWNDGLKIEAIVFICKVKNKVTQVRINHSNDRNGSLANRW